MRHLEFNKNKLKEVIKYDNKPVFEVINASFVTENKKWLEKLQSAYLSINIICKDKNAKVKNGFSLISFITPNHIQPTFEINRLFKFTNDSFPEFKNYKSKQWEIELELINLTFNDNEKLYFEILDSKDIKEKVDDWEERINGVLNNVEEWIKEDKQYSLEFSRKQKMHEGLMKTFGIPMREIPTVDLKKNGKTIIVIKQFGLWIIGANGRIDLLSSKGNHVLVDKADQFNAPDWYLYLINDKKTGLIFNKDNFYKILR